MSHLLLLQQATRGQQSAVAQLERIAAANRAIELGRITLADESGGYPGWIEARLGVDAPGACAITVAQAVSARAADQL